MIRLITLLLGALAAVMISLLWVVAAYTPPRGISRPSVVEKSCRLPGNMISVPCRYLDEYLETTWDI